MTSITEFINTIIIKKQGAATPSKTVSDAYIKFNGSSVGKNIMHRELSSMFNKQGTIYIGLYIKEEGGIIEPVVESVVEQVVAPVAEQVAETVKMSEYERQCLEIKKQKIAMQEKIAAEKKASEEKIAADKKASEEKDREFEERKLAIQSSLEERKLQAIIDEKEKDRLFEEKKLRVSIEEKEKDRAFMREENNKPRVITILSRSFNPKIDVAMYGTTTNQFLGARESKQRIGYGQFNLTNKVDKDIESSISEIIDSNSEDKIIYNGDNPETIRGIDVDKIPQVLKQIELADEAKEDFLKQVDDIRNALRDGKERTRLPILDHVKLSQDPDKHSKPKHKKHYIRTANKMRIKNNEVVINCYCCDAEYPLDSSAIHRCHNVPDSKGGDWSRSNIFLCCASCNQHMGDKTTVMEFKIGLYARIIDEDLA